MFYNGNSSVFVLQRFHFGADNKRNCQLDKVLVLEASFHRLQISSQGQLSIALASERTIPNFTFPSLDCCLLFGPCSLIQSCGYSALLKSYPVSLQVHTHILRHPDLMSIACFVWLELYSIQRTCGSSGSGGVLFVNVLFQTLLGR